jgi:hypothetical protein
MLSIYMIGRLVAKVKDLTLRRGGGGYNFSCIVVYTWCYHVTERT